MPVTLVINLCKWPSGNLRCHPCIALFHRWLEAHFKVQLTESLSKLLSLWSIPVKLAMIRDLYWITFCSIIIFQTKKAYKHILIAVENTLKGIKFVQKWHFTCNQSFNKSKSILSCESTTLLNLSVQLALCSHNQEGPKKYINLMIIENHQTHPALG